MFLFLNDVAGSEVLLIIVFILIFFGSKSIPGIARTVGRTIRQIQNASSDIQHEIKKTAGEYTKELNLSSILKETVEEVKTPLDQTINDLEHSVQYTATSQKNNSPIAPQQVKQISNKKTDETTDASHASLPKTTDT